MGIILGETMAGKFQKEVDKNYMYGIDEAS